MSFSTQSTAHALMSTVDWSAIGQGSLDQAPQPSTAQTQDGAPFSALEALVMGTDLRPKSAETAPEENSSSGISVASFFEGVSANTGLDAKSTALIGLEIAKSFQQSNSLSLLQTADDVVTALKESNTLPSELITNLDATIDAFQVLSNPGSNSAQQLTAAGVLLTELFTTSFRGSVTLPSSVGGVPVVGSALTDAGAEGFLLENGQIVAREDLLTRANAFATLQALSIVTSDASDEDKAFALAKVGISAAESNRLLAKGSAGNVALLLNVVQSSLRFDELSGVQQIGTVIQAGSLFASGLNQAGLLSNTSVSSINANLGAATGALAIVFGVDQAADVFSALSDLNRSHAVKAGAVGLGVAGAGIGAGITATSALIGGAAAGASAGASTGASAGSILPGPGTAIGAAIGLVVGGILGAVAGSFASGKSTAQKIRDSWRDGIEQMGIATKIDGSHHVRLKDGTLYDIGRDGGAKLPNVDGGERHTFDVDWSNPIAVQSIPDAHLFAIATGVNPSDTDFGAFSAILSQGLNAATSNATSVEAARENFRFMMEQAGVQPQELALQVEVLRHTASITEEEYQVYFAHINQLFGTQLLPTDKQVGHLKLINLIASNGSALSSAEKELLGILTSPKKLAENERALKKRKAQEVANRTRTPD